MKKRFMSMLLVLSMVFTLFPSAAFAEEAGTPIGTTSVTEGAPLCENHKAHNEGCGYIEAKDARPCGHLNEDGSYSCASVLDSGNAATPGDAEEKYVCDHSDGCGYAVVVEGSPCTHECELCKDIIADTCVCESHCTAELMNPDCPFCAAEGADLTKCVGAAAMMMAMPRGAVTPVSTIQELNDAISSATGDMIFQLTGPIAGRVIINGTTHNLTIDLNGQTLSGAGTDWVINHAGTKTLTIMDSSDGKNGKITSVSASCTIQVQGNVVLEITGGTVENTSTGVAIYNNSTSKTVISSGSPVIKSSGGAAMSKAPDVSSYDGVKVTASTSYNGTPTTPYLPANIANYKYLTFGFSAVKNATTNAEYDTLQAAIDAVAEGNTLQLQKNLTENVKIASGNSISFTIDLNGQTLDGRNDYTICHRGTGKLTIKDSGSNGTITSSFGEWGTVYCSNAGTTDTVLEVIGGTITNTNTVYSYGIYMNTNAKVSISGGTITGNSYAVSIDSRMQSAILTITGGVLDGKFGVVFYTGATVSIPSGSPVIKGSTQAMSQVPDLTGYTNVKVTASKNYDGATPEATYDAAKINDYKYLTFGVEAKTLSELVVTTQPTKTAYTAGESFDKSGMVVTANYSDGSVAVVTSYTVSPSDALATSDTKVTVSYTDGSVTKTADVNITVSSASSIIAGAGFSYDLGTKTLTITSNAGTTKWRDNTSITKADVTKVVMTGVTQIGVSAFDSCTSLASVTIPASVTTMSQGAFENCANLASVTFEGPTPPTTFGTDVFTNTTDTLKIYVPVDSVQAYKTGTTSAYASKIVAVGAITEQFTLPTGETYYFDLSGELGTVTNGVSSTIGTINVGKIGSGAYPGLPDPTLHYVPFTYTGTVNAYSLESSSSGQTGSSAAATASDRSLFVAEYNVSHTKSWDGLNTASLIFGKTLDTNYKLRSMSAGSSRSTDGGINTGAPVTNEWDCILTKNSDYIKNYKNINSCGQDTSASNSATRTVRGNGSARDYVPMSSSGVTSGCGFRPALEVLNPDALTSDGLKAVTLNLNGGKLKDSTANINIVCAGATFKAPSGEGLTPPSGKAFDKWNTAADGNGTSYAVGATVPSSITALYAQWKDVAPTTKISTTLNLMSVTADVKCTDSNVGTIITGMTQHTHADGTPCWAWDNTTKTLTLNDVDIEVSDAPVDTLFGSGIVLPDAAVTILFNGSNSVKGDTELNSRGITSQNYSITITGASEDAALAATGKSTGINASNGTVTITEGKITTSGKSYGIVGSLGITIFGGTVTATSTTITLNSAAIWTSGESDSIKLSGGTIIAQAGAGDAKAFMVEPVLSNGMAHKAGTGTWDNTAGTACVYEKGTAATVTAIAVTPKTASVQKGTTQQFNAAVTGTNNPAQTVTWTVTGGTKSGTTINASGLLTVAADETATSLTVEATSTVDTTKSDTATVTVTTPPVTKYALTVTNGTGGGDYEAGVTVTAIANTAPNGQRFKEWTATGITLTDKAQNSVTFAMPAGAVSLTAVYEPIPAETYTVTLDASGGSVSPTSLTITAGSTATLPTPSRSGRYRFDGWFTAASGGTQYTSSTPINSNVTLYAHWTYTGGDGGGSSSGGSSNIIVTPPAPDKPNTPTQAEIKVDGMTDTNGNTTIIVTDKNITDAIAKAEADAKKNGNTANGVTIVLSATGGTNATNVTVNLPKTVQDTIISKKVVSTIIVVDNPDVQIGMDLKAVTEINAQAKSDVNITAHRMDNGKLTGTAQTAIGSRPVFELAVNYGSGKQVESFGAGGVSVTIPYTLGANEKAGNVCAVYVDGSGKVQWHTSSVYDSTAKVLRFSTNHFSTYGVGYKQDTPAFTDIANHWAKADIEYVVSRGFFAGTGDTTFSPDTAITRGMFVTALGRLANADVSGYKTSSFSDVKADSYYMGYIEWANQNGIANGSDGKFMPDQSITREQMAVIMLNYAKTLGSTLPRVHEEKAFADSANISAYAKDAVKAMQMAGVLSGKSGNVLDPQGTATRAEVSAVLRRFVELRISIDTAQGWTMNDSGKWMYFEDGKPVTGKKDIGGVSYTFDQNGEMADVPKNLG